MNKSNLKLITLIYFVTFNANKYPFSSIFESVTCGRDLLIFILHGHISQGNINFGSALLCPQL